MQSNEEKQGKGTFLQVADVLLDTCDLPDEAIILFCRLLRQVRFKGTVFYGSIRKIGLMLNMKRDKVHRNIKVLDDAKLITSGISSDTDTSAIELHVDELRELNIAYCNGVEIPRWNNLQEVLEGVRKIGQDEQEEETNVVRKIGQSVLELGQDVAKIGQVVRRSERKVPPIDSKITKDKKDTTSRSYLDGYSPKKTPTPSKQKNRRPKRVVVEQVTLPTTSEVALSEAEQRIFDWYCQLDFVRKPPKIDEKRKGYCAALVPHVQSFEEMKSLAIHARELLKKRGITTYSVELGNLANSFTLNSWQKPSEGKPTTPSGRQYGPGEYVPFYDREAHLRQANEEFERFQQEKEAAKAAQQQGVRA